MDELLKKAPSNWYIEDQEALALGLMYYKRSPIPRRPRLAAEAPVFTVNGSGHRNC
jgi:hypothetical protein